MLCRDGEKIVLEGEGDQIPDVEAGDIIFHLDQAEHKVFRRVGSDLCAPLEVTLAEAICGFSRVVLKHLDGRGIEITHPKQKGDILRPGQVLKITGEGMPYKRSEMQGDLYLIVDIKFPDDGWAVDEPVLNKLREILPGSKEAPIQADIVDDVDYDPKGDIDNLGSKDERGGSAWVDEDDEDDEGGAQCTTQ